MRSLTVGALCLLALSACSAAPKTATAPPSSSSSAAPTTTTSKAPRPLVPPITEWPTWFDVDDTKTGFALQMPYKVPPTERSDSIPPERSHEIDLSPLRPGENTLRVAFADVPGITPAVLRKMPELNRRGFAEKGYPDAKLESVTEAVHNGLTSIDFVMTWTIKGTKCVRWSSFLINSKGFLDVTTLALGEAAAGPMAETMRQYHQKMVDSAHSL
ncbi:MAG TPA: hypothetical protein VM677_24690 [Actinokineospora sp.]|jgi:hypothetical protein|nr:hypothetical protein [Actinokineospora sp.]